MSYNEYFDLDLEKAKQYTVDNVDFFGNKKAEELNIEEVSDGNINHVYRIDDGIKSLILKQTGKTIRTSGNPLDQHRGDIEAKSLQIQRKLSNGQVPKVYNYNEKMHVLLMEDVSKFKNLRYELAKQKIFPNLAENISDFFANVYLPTTDLVMDRIEKKKMVGDFINPGPCDISEKLVLTEPYNDYLGRNIFDRSLNSFVKENLYQNSPLKVEIAKLRNNYLNNPQALLHGDLHTGSIFINEDDIRVFDNEFAFYGPIGYDFGNVIGNLIFPYVVKKVYEIKNHRGHSEFEQWLGRTIGEIYDLTFIKLNQKWNQEVKLSFYREHAFKNYYLRKIKDDMLGYAGTEIIRRSIGDTKVLELDEIEDQEFKNLVTKILVKIGIKLIMNRDAYDAGSEIVNDIDEMIILYIE